MICLVIGPVVAGFQWKVEKRTHRNDPKVHDNKARANTLTDLKISISSLSMRFDVTINSHWNGHGEYLSKD